MADDDQQGPGTPGDAGDALLGELKGAAAKIAEPQADPKVVATVRLGWLMDDVLDGRPTLDPDGQPLQEPVSGKTQARRLGQLATVLALPGDVAPAVLQAQLADGDADGARREAATWEATLKAWLYATDSRYLRGYDLGRRLCGLRRQPQFAWASLAPATVAPIIQRLDSLTTALPPHAGRGVANSLRRWTALAGRPADDPVKAGAPAVFVAQCDLWRQLLTGDKAATEVLEPENYLDAAERLAGKYVATVWLVVVKNKVIAIAAAALAAAGLLLLLGVLAFGGDDAAGGIAAGLSALLGAFGLTWKGVGTSVGKVAGRLEAPLWAAELDGAVTDAATLVDVPAPERSTRERRRTLPGGDYAGRGELVLRDVPE
jgi:hypothetical protein